MPDCKCTQCGNIFQSPWHLNRHMITHTGEKLFKCVVCDREFGIRSSYMRHLLMHTREEKCCMCPRNFKSKKGLESHLKIHDAANTHKCDICGSLFISLDALRKHNRSHTGEKPFKCDECGKAFTQSGYRNKHIREKHKEIQHPHQACGSWSSTTVHPKVDPLVGEVMSATQTVEFFDQTTAITDVWSRKGNARVEVTRFLHSSPSATVTTVIPETGKSVSSVDCGFFNPNSDLDPQDPSVISAENVFMGNERIDITRTPAPLTAVTSGTGSISSDDYGPPHLDDSDDDSDDLCNIPTENTSCPVD